MSKREYMAYLLRLWRENRDGSWRALLENPNTKERIGFANLNELVEFLESKTGEAITVPQAEEKEQYTKQFRVAILLTLCDSSPDG